MKSYTGIFVALTTPMKQDGTLDYTYIGEKLRKLGEAGINQFFCLGTNGEFYALSREEKKRYLAVVKEAAPKGALLSAGIGAVTTEESIDLARTASCLGYDLATAITPYFLQLSEEQMLRHFQRIADASDIPLLLYNIPARAGNVLSPGSALKLSAHPRIAGIKDSSGSLDSVKAFIALNEPGFSVFSGTDSLILDALAAGSDGAVSGLANLFPELVLSVYDHFRAGEREKAAAAQKRVSALRKLIEYGYSVSVIKLAENLLGLPVGPSRAPADIKDEETIAKIASFLDSFCGDGTADRIKR